MTSAATIDNPGNSPLLQWIRDHLDYPHDYCLLWPYARNSAGYATVSNDGRREYVHRLICEKVNGPAPDGHQAAHSCGRGAEGCVNGRHLSWKSPADNQLDRREHGTNRIAHCKLSEAQVIEIRLLKGQVPVAVLAGRYDVTEANIRQIQNGQTWQPGRKRRLTPEAVLAIFDAKGTCRQLVLAKQYGVSKATIGLIQTGKSHKAVLTARAGAQASAQ